MRVQTRERADDARANSPGLAKLTRSVAGLAIIVALVVSVFMLRGIPLGDPHRGYVFWNGSYIQPPYTFHVLDGDIYFDGRLIQRALKPGFLPPLRRWDGLVSQLLRAKPDLAASYRLAAISVDSPLTADEIAEFASALLRNIDVSEPDTRMWLEFVLRQLSGSAAIADDGMSLAITDRGGKHAQLLVVSMPTETTEAVFARQASEAAMWREVLAGGGGLFLSTNAILLVPASQAPGFGAALMRAYDLPAGEQLAAFTRLTGVREIARSLVASGPPVPAVAQVLASSGKPRSQQADQTTSTPPSNAQSLITRDLSTPAADLAVVYSGRSTDGGLVVSRVALERGYRVIRIRSPQCYGGADDRDTGLIDDILQSGPGIFYASAWGLPGLLGLDDYCSRDGAESSATAYQQRGITVRILSTPETYTRFVLAVPSTEISARWKDRLTIVHLDSCGSWTLRSAFNAREFIGADARACDRLGVSDDRFWNELRHVTDRVATVGDAFEVAYSGSHFSLGGTGRGATILAPAVISYGASPLSPNDATSAFAVFDAGMDTTSHAADILSVEGSGCAVDVVAARWDTDRRLSFSLRQTTHGPGSVLLRVHSPAVRSAGMLPLMSDFSWRIPCG